MKPLKALLTLCFSALCLFGAKAEPDAVYATQIFQQNVRTLRIRSLSDPVLERPILTLGSDEVLEISFDELSHSTHQYSYTLLHLNAKGEQDDLFTTDYLEGFPDGDITDYDFSLNTQQLYTHYRFEFPNADMRPTLSGNYALLIYEDGDRQQVVATVFLQIVEPLTQVEATLRANTDLEFSGRYQQLDIEVDTRNLSLRNSDEIRLVVQQNGRWDNAVFFPRPTYVETNRLRFVQNKSLIFEATNEYRNFDLASVYYMGRNVDRIEFDHNFYHAFLYPSEHLENKVYLTQNDANGQFVINAERTSQDDYQADYMFVYFFLPQETPFFDGSLYLGGDLNYNLINANTRMQYDNEHHAYYYVSYLKQGGYDFQYWFVPKNATRATTARTEGNYWQTQNEYTISVFYHPFGARYDQLIAFLKL